MAEQGLWGRGVGGGRGEGDVGVVGCEEGEGRGEQ